MRREKMLKYQLIRTNKDHDIFVAMFEDSEEDKAWTCFEYEKMHKDTLSMIIVELNVCDCEGKILKSYRA